MRLRKRVKWLWRNRKWYLRAWVLEDRALEGLGGPPNNFRNSPLVRGHHDDVSYSASFKNDAFEVWFWQEFDGERGRWVFSLDATAFRRLALWYLWRWIFGEWLGLRRRLYYWDLRRRVDAMLDLAERH